MLHCIKHHELINESEKIEFTFLIDEFTFPFPENEIREWIFFICQSENKEIGLLNFIFCSDTYLYEMNKSYLNHDTYTDVITFDYCDDFGNLTGDIFISVDRVKENSQNFQSLFLKELSRVIAHGVLHLIGYKDKKRKEIEEMRAKENFYLDVLEIY